MMLQELELEFGTGCALKICVDGFSLPFDQRRMYKNSLTLLEIQS